MRATSGRLAVCRLAGVWCVRPGVRRRGREILRVNARVAGVVAAATLCLVPGLARAAELPRGPVTAQTVASAQAEATTAAAASTEAARQAAEAGVALDAAKAASTAAA